MKSATQLVGILNLTPDSFSSDGLHGDVKRATEKFERMLAEGADIIDIGAESTRPGAQPVAPEEEWTRLKNFLPFIRKKFPMAVLSIDTRHAATARRAIDAGADWINDVSGLGDETMVAAVQGSAVRLVAMHSLSVPPRKEEMLSESLDIADYMIAAACAKIAQLERLGIGRERVIFDPGIGFGTSPQQSLALIKRAGYIQQAIAAPLLIGHSRKSFLKSLFPEAETADAATLALSKEMMRAGVAYLRVHDVAGHRSLRDHL